jgi:glycogen debranching enzyme
MLGKPMPANDLRPEAIEAAIETLRRCATPIGLKASGGTTGHKQVWARDSIIALLGARLAEDATIRVALHASLATLKAWQSATGIIPNNVDVEKRRPNFHACADSGLWWIIGSSLMEPDLATIRSVLHWYECQDVDQSGLVSMQEATDWQDIFCTRGKGLYVNCLYVLALRAAARIASGEESERWSRSADLAAERINDCFWRPGSPRKPELADQHFYLPYLDSHTAGEWFDCLGNLLAILSGVASADRTARILDLIENRNLDVRPLPAIYPPVFPGDPDWRDYYGTLNIPHRYHNGGIWPFIGGFYVAALVKAGRQRTAEVALERLADLNRDGAFNEWHDATTGEAAGARDQAWSAGMYLFARNALVQADTSPF